MTFGVAVIGLGVGQSHLTAFTEDDRCEVRWVCDLDLGRAEAAAAAGNPAPRIGQFDQILGDSRTSIVCIASFDHDHAAQALACLQAGKHVFVEKPLCRTVDELQAIRTAWAAHEGRVKLTSNLVLRTAPLYRWLKSAIDNGVFGQLYAFDGEYLYGRVEKITDGWRGEGEYSVMLGGGIHLMDLFLWLSGERPCDVSAWGNQIVTRGTRFQHADYVTTTLRMPSGLLGRITANFGCVHQHQHVLRLYGTQATFLYDDAGARLHQSRQGVAAPVEFGPLPIQKSALIRGFVDAIAQDQDLKTETQAVFDTISACLACDESRRAENSREVRYV